MSIEDVSSSDPVPGNVAAPTPARREGEGVLIARDIMDALAKDIQQLNQECSKFKDISNDPSARNVAALTRAWREGKELVPSIKHQFRYVMSSKSYAQDLQKEVEKLAYKTERVHNAVEEARNNLRNVSSQVTVWQASAVKALTEARDLLSDFKKATETCCYGFLPHPNCRYQFSRKAHDKIEDIQRLARESSEFKDISFSNPAPGNVAASILAEREGKDVVQSTTITASTSSSSMSIKLRNNGVFESRAKIIRNIMDALGNNSNRVVGVYGMGGVGKSTLLADTEKRIREEKSFDLVAKADVTEHQDIKRIQEEIALALGLSDIKNEEYVSMRAELLRKWLENEVWTKTKVLIILDNLWGGLDLNKVGIPCEHDNKVIGCQLLLTSRDRDVLRREMCCDRDFLLGGLQEEEAKKLFGRMVGNKVHNDEFKPLVDEALHNCEGLPFLILAMAKLFKDADLSEWKEVLKQIKMSKNEGITEVINNMLQLSYDRLKVKEAKSLLQLCVVYSVSKPSLENLVRYSVGLGLFGENSSMEEARNRLSSLIRTLQASSLLLENGDNDGFKVHDLVRKFVASIIARDQPLLVLKDKDKFITKLPKDKLKYCSAICFPYIDMKELPEELDCPELQIFLLFTNNESFNVPGSLFNSMRKLIVLNLTGIRLTLSPSPFQLLENLCTLCLDGCTLDDVAILGELKGLQILSFVNSKIQRLPKEIGQLVELRLLDLNNCFQLQIIEPGVLGSLIKLEELYVENSFDQWNAMEQTPPTNASLIELNNMKNLCTLYVYIHDPIVLPKDLNIKKLTKYGIRIGGRCSSSRKGSRTLELKLNPIRDILKRECIQIALDKSDDLYLDELNGIEQNICELLPEDFPNLKHLHIENSPSAQYIFRQVAFPSLETLNIIGMHNIKMIWNNQVYFQHLKTLDVSHCHRLSNMFTVTIAGNLVELTKLRISNCKMLTEVISDEGGKEGHAKAFNQLKSIELYGLTGLRCFSSGGYTLMFPLLKDVIVTRCLNMKFFSKGPIEAPKLEKVHVSTTAWFWKGNLNITIQNMYEEMATVTGVKFMRLFEFPELIGKWHSGLIPIELFSKLESLVVDKCPSIINAIPSILMLALRNMRSLQVRDCESLEEIFDLEGLEVSESTHVLPRLWHLGLVNLPKLRRLGNKNLQGRLCFNSISHLTLYKCSNLRHAFAPSMIWYLATLEYTEIKECGQMEGLIAEEEGHGSAVEKITFPNLWWMELEYLPNLTSFLSGKNHMLDCPELKWLTIAHCPRMRSFSGQSLMEIDHGTPTLFTSHVAFPSLDTLHITGMDNIEMIWDNQVATDSFQNLKSLYVVKCNKLVNIIPSCILGWLWSLESLEAKECGSLEVVFELHPLNSLDGHHAICFPLKKLELFELPELKCIWDNDFHCQVKFQFLCSVSVSRCKGLASLFSASVAKDLMQLEELEINECGIVKLIEVDRPVPGFVFPKLTSLKLKHLTKLMCIDIGFDTLHWPALKTLEVHDCHKVEIFALQGEFGTKISYELPLFLINKVEFPILETLRLTSMDNIVIIWDYQVAANSFHNLKSLYVDECQYLYSIWHNELHRQVKFQHLRSVSVSRCKRLTSLFPASIARDLMQLEELKIDECGIVELIEEEVRLAPRFVFPNLTSLELKHLTELKRLYNGTHTSHWPALKTLKVDGCKKVEMLASQPQNEMPCQKESLFLIEKVAFPNLETLHITHMDNIKMISDNQVDLQHLKTLDVSHCDLLSYVFTPTIAENLVELAELRISNCKMLTEVISDEGGKEGHVGASNQCKNMELDWLTRLRCFARREGQGSTMETIRFPNLLRVELECLPKLTSFLSGNNHTLEWPILEELTIANCPKMTRIGTLFQRPPSFISRLCTDI